MMAAVLSIWGCADTAIAQNDAPTGGRAHAACAQMGLNSSEAPFADCLISLRRSARATTAVAEVSADRSACGQQGLQPGTAAFANCVLDKQEAAGQ
jgi:hypothetical protein